MKRNQLGRSMVEMLGVLAIIGVLSVGAISGYSNAMTKHKLNKQTEQIGSIIDNVHINMEALKRSKTQIGAQDLILVLKGLQILPKEMIKDNTKYIYDSFNNIIHFQNLMAGEDYVFEFIMSLKTNKDSCINLVKTAKLHSKELWRIKIEGSQAIIIRGDATCFSGYECLKDTTLDKMEEYCNMCTSSPSCHFYFQEYF